MTQTQHHHPAGNDDLADLNQAARTLAPAVADAIAKYYDLLDQINAIVQAGIVIATPYIMDEKYMYLIHPTDPNTGERQREYIGADAAKQTEAYARIHRHKQHHDLCRQADRVKTNLKSISYELHRILVDLGAK